MFKRGKFIFWSVLGTLGLVALTSGCLGGSVQYDAPSGKAVYVIPLGVSSPTPAPSIWISIPTLEPIKATETAVAGTNELVLLYATQTAVPVRQTEEALARTATQVGMSVDATMQAVSAQSTQVAATQIAAAVAKQQWEATQSAISEQEAEQSRIEWEQTKEIAAQVFIAGGIALAFILVLILVTLVTVDVRAREREAQTALLVAKAQADEQNARLLAMHDRLAASITEAMPVDLPVQKVNGNGHPNGSGKSYGNGKTNGNGHGYGQNGASITGQDHGTNKNDDSLRKPQQGRGPGNSNLPLAG
jgi:hypothetical protein